MTVPIAGAFGNVMFVKCQALRRRGIPNWGVFGRKELQGGGPMIDIGVHCIEMAHYVMGSSKPVAASGNTWTVHAGVRIRKIRMFREVERLGAELDLDAPGANVAVDRVIVRGDTPLSATSEVAFLPPMSGG